MIIELKDALLDVVKVNYGKHVVVYKKDGVWKHAGSFGIEGRTSKAKIIQTYEENKEEF